MQGKRKLQRYVLTLGGVGRVGIVVQIGFQRSKLYSRMMMRSTVKIIMRIVTQIEQNDKVLHSSSS